MAVYSPEGSDALPACIAVSPEGIIRYWQTVAHTNSFAEISADLQVLFSIMQTIKYMPASFDFITETSGNCLLSLMLI